MISFYCLSDLGFTPSKAGPDIWMRLNKKYNMYEYVAVYVDDLSITMKIAILFGIQNIKADSLITPDASLFPRELK